MTKKEALQKLKEIILKDKSLPLRKGATQLVFGDGNENAEIFCLGEAPGFWEDQKGTPFVGNAGHLLNQLLESIEIKRDDVFITNVVLYRPPQNRDPLPEEIKSFEKYIDKMIAIVNPKLVLTLGRFSMAKFLGQVKISSVHGNQFQIKWKDKDIIIVPMYHPAAALRNEKIMRQIKEDFLKLPKVLEEVNKKEITQMKLI
jgi:DNA polymerase